jgi:arsenate reductase (glutaredoxin)
MIVYVYSKCSTCKDALNFLKKHEVKCTVKEISQEPPSVKELKEMLKYQNGELKKLFNTSGILYKEMDMKDKLQDMSLEQALKLLSEHGMLVKRPFVLGDGFGLVGFKEAEWTKSI